MSNTYTMEIYLHWMDVQCTCQRDSCSGLDACHMCAHTPASGGICADTDSWLGMHLIFLGFERKRHRSGLHCCAVQPLRNGWSACTYASHTPRFTIPRTIYCSRLGSTGAVRGGATSAGRLSVFDQHQAMGLKPDYLSRTRPQATEN